VQLLFVLTAALFDASIACWSGKYKFNKPRPITAANVYPDDLVQPFLHPVSAQMLKIFERGDSK
jgi:hypothetical protein